MKHISFVTRLGAGLIAVFLASAARAQQVVLDFEDLTGFAPMPANYGGIANWGSWAHSDLVDINYPAYSGTVKILSVGLQQSIVFGQPYVFDGARVVTAFPFSFQLYYQGALVHTTAVLQPNTGGPAAWLASGYAGLVDEVRYVSNVNVHGVDDFTYTIPGGPPAVYCTAGTTTFGCNATIAASAHPSLTSAGCVLTISNVEGQKTGIVFYGLSSQATPWTPTSSSFLCVKAPTQRTPTQNSGGTLGQCDGTLTLDWDAFQSATSSAVGQPWTAGDLVYAQGWFRDPPAPKTTSLSNAIELTYQP